MDKTFTCLFVVFHLLFLIQTSFADSSNVHNGSRATARNISNPSKNVEPRSFYDTSYLSCGIDNAKDAYCCNYVKTHEAALRKRLESSIWAECEALWKPEAPREEKRYSVYRDKVKWDEAIRRCNAVNQRIATVTSERDQRELEETLIQHGLPGTHEHHKVWLGGNDHREFGNFQWVGRPFVPFDYKHWDRDEPRNHKNNHCLVAKLKDFFWMRVHCNQNYFYVCEYMQ